MRSVRAHRQLPPPDGTVTEGGVVTLDQVRPHPRTQNEYVDGPKLVPLGSLKPHQNQSQVNTNSGIPLALPNRVQLPTRQSTGIRSDLIISRQPVSISPPLKKEILIDRENDEIICSKCGKCRCGSCTEPQSLPSRWCCGDKCQVSPESAVENCTCFCCVKGVFYHCGKDEQDSDYMCYADPCACCSKPHCFKRWTCMAIMATCLPCLLCYWPARGALKACTMCYNKCRKKGCQCGKHTNKKDKNGSQLMRGLLIESDSSSA